MTDPRIAGQLETGQLEQGDKPQADLTLLAYLQARQVLSSWRKRAQVVANTVYFAVVCIATIWLLEWVGWAPWVSTPAPLTAEDLQVHSLPSITNGDGHLLEFGDADESTLSVGGGMIILGEVTTGVFKYEADASDVQVLGIYRSEYPDASPEPGHVWSCRFAWTDDVNVSRCLDSSGWRQLSLEEAAGFEASAIGFDVRLEDLVDLRSIGIDVAPICEWLAKRISDPGRLATGGDLWDVCGEPVQ